MTKKRKKILIVDDSKKYLWILLQAFTREGFITVAAENGEEGLASAKKEKPDLILSDLIMPKMDGLEMARKIKEANILTPIIFLTDMDDIKYISDAVELAEGYIIKSDQNLGDIVAKVKDKLNIK